MAIPKRGRRLDNTEAAQVLRRFNDSSLVLTGTVELDGDDIIHISDNNVSATFFGTISARGYTRPLS